MYDKRNGRLRLEVINVQQRAKASTGTGDHILVQIIPQQPWRAVDTEARQTARGGARAALPSGRRAVLPQYPSHRSYKLRVLHMPATRTLALDLTREEPGTSVSRKRLDGVRKQTHGGARECSPVIE
ncbi:hypothetical protein J6590_028856 [Homalodisca vitripennis]|nr:hypothetical protein J6590_028856 [Homalodisca vitripennis]